MLEAMVDCAHGLGMSFGKAAQAEADTKRCLELAEAFQRSFLAVRMGIRLSLTLRAGKVDRSAVAAREALDRVENERPDQERDDSHGERERERDREYEPVSLPRFLATLGVIAADADRLGDGLPADVAAGALPRLHDLLARAKAAPPEPAATPAPGVTVLARPRGPTARAALLGSASVAPARPLAVRGPGLPRPPPRGPG